MARTTTRHRMTRIRSCSRSASSGAYSQRNRGWRRGRRSSRIGPQHDPAHALQPARAGRDRGGAGGELVADEDVDMTPRDYYAPEPDDGASAMTEDAWEDAINALLNELATEDDDESLQSD